MDHRLVGGEQLGDRAGLVVDRTDPGEVGDLGVDREEAADPSRRRRIHDQGVVGPRTVSLVLAVPASPIGFVDLPDDQDVAHPRRDGGGEVDGAELLEELAGPAELVEHLKVLEQGRLGVDGQADDHATARRLGDPGLLGAEWGHLEGLADPLTALDLGEQHRVGFSGQGKSEGGGHRRLAGATLSGHDVQSGAHADHPMAPAVPR